MEALRRSEARLRLTMAAVQDGLWEWDTRTGIIEMDKRCHQMLGYEVLSQKLNFQTWQSMCTLMTATGCSPRCNARLPWAALRHGNTPAHPARHMAVDGNPRASCAGRHRNCRAGHRHPDRHHPRKQETHLRQALLDNAAAALLISTPSASLRWPTQSRGDLLAGRTACKAKSLSVLHRHEAAFTQFLPYVDAVREQGGVEVEYLMRTATGALRWFSIRGTPWIRSSQRAT